MSKLIRNMFIAALFAGAFSLTASAADPAATPVAEPVAAPAEAPAAATKAAPPPKNTKAATAEAPKPAPEVKTTATVITNEGLSERCILSVVVTAVDGKEVTATDKTDTFEFAPGEHSISGHGGADPTKCATFTGDNPVALTEGEIIGQSTLKFTVVAGKTYYLGVDVRKPEKSTWKIVVWQIKH